MFLSKYIKNNEIVSIQYPRLLRLYNYLNSQKLDKKKSNYQR